MRNLESRIESDVLYNIDLESAFKKAQEILKDAIKLADFKKLYGEENVKKDEKFVIDKEISFADKETDSEQERINKLSTIFETIIYEQSELNNWLGADIETIKSSRFDEIVNGVDSIVEFHEKERSASHLALAIDVTFSSNLENKFKRIREEIKNGELTSVKYFYSDFSKIRGELTKIPRMIVGANLKTVKDLFMLWLNEDNKKLSMHPIQLQILDEILLQTQAFKQYANLVNQSEIASIYGRVEDLIRPIYTEKQKSLADSGKRDSVFYMIRNSLNNFEDEE